MNWTTDGPVVAEISTWQQPDRLLVPDRNPNLAAVGLEDPYDYTPH